MILFLHRFEDIGDMVLCSVLVYSEEVPLDNTKGQQKYEVYKIVT